MIRRLIAWMLGTMVVDLQDFDGEVVRRLARRDAFGWKANRMSFGIRIVRLEDGGTLGNGSYVKRWAVAYDYREAR